MYFNNFSNKKFLEIIYMKNKEKKIIKIKKDPKGQPKLCCFTKTNINFFKSSIYFLKIA